MVSRNVGPNEALRPVEPPKIMSKPLPQILDEMEDNVRAAAEAARRAEEAARAAKQAAGTTTRASREVEERTEEARLAGEKAAETATRAVAEAATKAEEASATAKEAAKAVKAEMLQHIESLEVRIKSLEDAIPEEKIVVLRQISREEAVKEILELFSRGQTLYYSDVAEKLGLDLKLVVEICSELQSRGEIEVVDDALQRR